MTTLTAYHIRNRIDGQEVTSFDQIIKDLSKVDSLSLSVNMPFEAKLFITRQGDKRASWITFLRKGFHDIKITLTKNINAVLLIRIPYDDKNEYFAFTFGHGRHLLKPYCYDLNYGLRVALNAIYELHEEGLNSDRIKVVDTKNMSHEVSRTRKQTDRKTAFEAFRADVRGDLLHGIIGTPVNQDAWGKLISGSSSVSANPHIEIKELGNYCKLLADTYKKTTYKRDFSWIDNIKAVYDPEHLKELEGELLHALREDSEAICLTVPDIMESENIENYFFSFDENCTFSDPEDVRLVPALKKTGHFNELSIENLRDEWTLESDNDRSWSLLNCLYGEIKHNGKTYMITESQFWEVEKDFIEELERYLATIDEVQHGLPDSPGDIAEVNYNEFVSKKSASFLMLDRKVVVIRGRTTPIEICDLLTDSGCFIHIKRKLNSSTLSHLFAQGYNSAILLSENDQYREAVLSKISEQENIKISELNDKHLAGKFSSFTRDNFIAGNHEITFAIIAKWGGRSFVNALPFFSKLTLRSYVGELRRMGYKISLARISINESAA